MRFINFYILIKKKYLHILYKNMNRTQPTDYDAQIAHLDDRIRSLSAQLAQPISRTGGSFYGNNSIGASSEEIRTITKLRELIAELATISKKARLDARTAADSGESSFGNDEKRRQAVAETRRHATIARQAASDADQYVYDLETRAKQYSNNTTIANEVRAAKAAALEAQDAARETIRYARKLAMGEAKVALSSEIQAFDDRRKRELQRQQFGGKYQNKYLKYKAKYMNAKLA
jgi:hypothetical protein